jgi:hypothetical protein
MDMIADAPEMIEAMKQMGRPTGIEERMAKLIYLMSSPHSV